MLEDFYTSIEVHRETGRSDDWGNTTKRSNYTLNGTIQGFFQPRTGSFANTNQSNVPLSSAVLYTNIGADVQINDRVISDGQAFQVTFVQAAGIGGISDHQEIGLSYLNDQDLT